jgi:hypothetical protein
MIFCVLGKLAFCAIVGVHMETLIPPFFAELTSHMTMFVRCALPRESWQMANLSAFGDVHKQIFVSILVLSVLCTI